MIPARALPIQLAKDNPDIVMWLAGIIAPAATYELLALEGKIAVARVRACESEAPDPDPRRPHHDRAAPRRPVASSPRLLPRIRARPSEGVAAQAARSRRVMTKLTPERLADFYRDSREQGIGHDEIANLLGVQRDSLTRRLGRHGIALIPEPLLKDECGYLGKYRDGCRCDACRAANAEFTASTRARRLPRRESAQFNHGRSGYVNWGCRCDVCSAAHSDSLRRRRRERMRNLDKAPHGTAAGYSGWGCRCEPCRTAAAIDRANRRRKLRAASGDPGPERSTPK